MNKQTGSALIISLLILVVMTLLGISSMSTSIMEERMAANDRQQKLVFQKAESSLINTENDILQREWNGNLQVAFGSSANTSFIPAGSPRFDYYDQQAWDDNATCTNTENGKTCYIVEEVAIEYPAEIGGQGQPFLGKHISKVTTRTSENNNATAVMLQSGLQKNIVQ